ncbi:MAG: cell wall associated protein, partial [Clostridiaceae bacterium]|nr:cell wall associated protein [Clostridiaceae bacterium]
YASEMWNILDMVNDWYKNGNNYGLMLKYLRKNENIAPQGYSSGVSTSFRSTNFYKYDPQVILYYVNNSGLEDYWTYHSQSLGRAGTGYVNNSSGNLVFIHNDVTTTGYKSNLILNHVYNNKRWRLSLKQTIEKETIENELYYIYTDEDGTKHYFKGTGKDQSGLNLYLSKLSDGSFRIKDKKDNTLYFNDDGDLTSITNPVEGIVRVQYDGGSRIASVTDGAGRITKINYANSQLDNIVDPAGRITYFRYTNSKLTQIDYPDGKASKYSYNSDGLLETVTDCSGYKVTYLYNNSNPKRVNKIKESNSDGTLGNELSIVYGSKHTEFTDVKGRKYTYQFNDWGNTICVTDHEGNAQYYKYLRESNLNNKLSLQSKLQKSIVNYVKNHNAEADSAWVDSGDTGSTGSMSYDSTQKYLGKRSIKIIKTNTTNAKYAQQAIDLEKGKTYTFSAYIKTNGISSINKNGAALIAYYKNNADVWQSVCSKFVNGTNDWQRHEVSFTVPSDSSSNSVLIRLAIAGETGTAYFDCMQLESGLVANRYNILENSDMIYGTSIPDFWTTANCDSNDKLVNTAGELRPGNINSKCFKIKGYPKDEKYLEQKINTSIKKGDVFTFGAWIKQDSALKGAEIAIFFDNRYSSLGALKTNTCFTGWQYVSDRIVAGLDSSNITLRITYKDANEAYFDGIQLCKEEFGVSYQYDDEGNVVSTVDLAEQNSKFEYNSTNDLIKTVSPKGNEFRYEYNTLHQMEKAITAENI